MTKRVESKYKINRRLGVNLWGRPKSPLAKRDYGPGQHGQRRKGKPTDFGVQLMAKQKLKGYYGNIGEKQFRKYYFEAARRKGNTDENLIDLLERRLDDVLYRMGFSASRRQARQLIAHGLIFVNGQKLDRASYLVELNDVITPRPKEKTVSFVKAVRDAAKGRVVPSWLDAQAEPIEGRVLALPKADELAEGFEPQLIVEICGR